MVSDGTLELLLLHALPLDGSMWAGQMHLLPGSTHAPTLYPLGGSIEEWAGAALTAVKGNRLIVVGCSVGGSCALEVAAIAPDRVAALVLIGTKARHRPDPALHASALAALRDKGLEEAWHMFWERLISPAARKQVRDDVKRIALRQSVDAIARGVTVFHRRPSRDRLLARFPGPVVLVSGAEDGAPGPAMSAAQAALAPQGRVHVIPHCGHYVPMECPEDLNRILGDVIAALR